MSHICGTCVTHAIPRLTGPICPIYVEHVLLMHVIPRLTRPICPIYVGHVLLMYSQE